MEVVLVVLALIVGRATWGLIKFLWHRHRFPYRYHCDQCSFSFETNVRETYEISKSSHNHSRLKEFKPQ